MENISNLEAAEKYRDLKLLLVAIEKLPKHIRECKLSAPPFIPKEFRAAVSKTSNMFFSPFEFSIEGMAKHLKELKDLYKPHVLEVDRKEIDKIL